VAQYRTRKATLDGLVLVDKPTGCTSHDVVARVRRALRPAVRKVGHAGTLDPFATGLLLVLVGRATKLARFFVDLPKEYVCTMRFGARSDTGDVTGRTVETGVAVTLGEIQAVLPRFRGAIVQRVPMTSAVKVDGERLYRKAHRGETVETPVKEVEIELIEVEAFDEPSQALRCRVVCSKGTYVRQLAIDIGEAAGGGAYVEELARTATGPFRLAEARTLAAFEEAVAERPQGDETIPGLVSPSRALEFMPALEVASAQVPRIRNGARLSGGPRQPVRVVHRGEFLAVYGPADEGVLKPLVVM